MRRIAPGTMSPAHWSSATWTGAALLVAFLAQCLYALFWVATAIASGDLPWVQGP